MRLHRTGLGEVVAIEPEFSFKDVRGTIVETFNQKEFQKAFPDLPSFVKTNISLSHYNVLRGVHVSLNLWKLFHCVIGTVQVAVVDCREDSQSFGAHRSWLLSGPGSLQILIPPGYGLAHLVRSDVAAVEYHWSADYDGPEQKTYRFDDPRFGIHWGWPILSQRDRNA